MKQKQQQLDAVRRKMVASIHKPVIQHAVESGFDRNLVEEILVLCGGDKETVVRMWAAFKAQTWQQDEEQFDLAEFVEFIKAQQQPQPSKADIEASLALLGERRRRRRRKKKQHGKSKGR